MQNVKEALVGVLPVDLVSALDAEVKRGRRVGRESHADAVVVAYLGRLRVACVGAHVALADKWHQII